MIENSNNTKNRRSAIPDNPQNHSTPKLENRSKLTHESKTTKAGNQKHYQDNGPLTRFSLDPCKSPQTTYTTVTTVENTNNNSNEPLIQHRHFSAFKQQSDGESLKSSLRSFNMGQIQNSKFGVIAENPKILNSQINGNLDDQKKNTLTKTKIRKQRSKSREKFSTVTAHSNPYGEMDEKLVRNDNNHNNDNTNNNVISTEITTNSSIITNKTKPFKLSSSSNSLERITSKDIMTSAGQINHSNSNFSNSNLSKRKVQLIKKVVKKSSKGHHHGQKGRKPRRNFSDRESQPHQQVTTSTTVTTTGASQQVTNTSRTNTSATSSSPRSSLVSNTETNTSNSVTSKNIETHVNPMSTTTSTGQNILSVTKTMTTDNIINQSAAGNNALANRNNSNNGKFNFLTSPYEMDSKETQNLLKIGQMGEIIQEKSNPSISFGEGSTFSQTHVYQQDDENNNNNNSKVGVTNTLLPFNGAPGITNRDGGTGRRNTTGKKTSYVMPHGRASKGIKHRIRFRSDMVNGMIGTQYELLRITTFVLLVYILAGGLVFRQLEHKAEHARCQYITKELNETFPKIQNQIYRKVRDRVGLQFNDFYRLAHIFAEIQLHKATLSRIYKNETIVLDGSAASMKELERIELLEKRENYEIFKRQQLAKIASSMNISRAGIPRTTNPSSRRKRESSSGDVFLQNSEIFQNLRIIDADVVDANKKKQLSVRSARPNPEPDPGIRESIKRNDQKRKNNLQIPTVKNLAVSIDDDDDVIQGLSSETTNGQLNNKEVPIKSLLGQSVAKKINPKKEYMFMYDPPGGKNQPLAAPEHEPHIFTVTCKEIWGYWDSVYFAGTVITTIGYGQIAPSTPQGRIFCMLYMVFGITIFMVFAISLSKIVRTNMRKIRKYYFSNSSYAQVKYQLMVTVCFTFFFIIVPALFFHLMEDGWTFVESFYYVVVTVTTVGFGDYVPGKAHQSVTEDGSLYHESAYWSCFGGCFEVVPSNFTIFDS